MRGREDEGVYRRVTKFRLSESFLAAHRNRLLAPRSLAPDTKSRRPQTQSVEEEGEGSDLAV
jgi:hypothetical protein